MSLPSRALPPPAALAAAFAVALVGALVSRAGAHHGVASLGVAGLNGPGAPVETSSSATLPPGRFLAYAKLDYASFEKRTAARDDEGDVNAFWMYGLGYGITPWLSAYAFLPFSVKRTENHAFDTAGFADVAVLGVVGFKLDEGLRLVPSGESLDELEDWHFTVYAGGTLPTGDEDIADADGAIDPGMSLGFGRPSWTTGLTVTKPWGRATWVGELSTIGFLENEYADGTKLRFGSELRANAALAMRVMTSPARKLRLDANLEGNFLSLGRDEVDGVGERATGGTMLYALPGLRLFLESVSFGVGVKFPVWTDLNEESEQQGAEGGEDWRLVTTFSTLF